MKSKHSLLSKSASPAETVSLMHEIEGLGKSPIGFLDGLLGADGTPAGCLVSLVVGWGLKLAFFLVNPFRPLVAVVFGAMAESKLRKGDAAAARVLISRCRATNWVLALLGLAGWGLYFKFRKP